MQRPLFALISLLLVLAFVANQTNQKSVIGNKAFHLEIVDKPAEREKGLSGRESLAKDAGMLFVFDTPQTRCFWMKDMRFAIDMIWLDENDKITAIEESVPPQSYPQSFCHHGQYVLELNAGQAEKTGLEFGQTLEL